MARLFLSPCQRNHSLAEIKDCAECLKLYVPEAGVTMPRELLDAAVVGGYVDRIDVDDTHRFYNINELIRLHKQSAKDKQKIIALGASRIASPSPPTEPTLVYAPPVRVASPQVSPIRVVSSQKVISVKRQKLESPTVVGPHTASPTSTISVIIPTATTSTSPFIAPCDECHYEHAKARKCTNNRLCERCRKLPKHKLISELMIFRTFRSLSYNDIDRGLQAGTVRDVPLPFTGGKTKVAERYFYKEDIAKLL